MKQIFLYLIVLCVAVVSVPSLSAQAKLDRTTTIDVSAVAPRDVFASLSRLLGYELTIAPEIQKPVTMHLENVTVRTALNALSENLECQWSIAGNTLRVRPAGSGKPGPARITRGFPGRVAIVLPRARVGKADYKQMMECRMPANFRFENAPVGSITDALGKVCEMAIIVDESDGARQVTIDLGNRKILSALKALSEQAGLRGTIIISQGSRKSLILLKSPPKKDR